MGRPQIVNWSEAQNTSDEHVSHLLQPRLGGDIPQFRAVAGPADVACLRVTRRLESSTQKLSSFLLVYVHDSTDFLLYPMGTVCLAPVRRRWQSHLQNGIRNMANDLRRGTNMVQSRCRPFL